MLKKKKILGINITDEDLDYTLEYTIQMLHKNDKKLFIVTPNPEIIVIAKKDFDYKKVLNSAEIALPDGVGILLAGQILGKPFKKRISGIDFMEVLCRKVSKQPITVGFLGGRSGVAEETAKCLGQKYSGLKVTFVSSEPPGNLGSIKCDMLFVAFGSPKQEKWIAENLDKLPVKAAMGVGGAFDMISGKAWRAPLFLRKLGLEWLFRLITQPWRIKRQFRLLEFIFLVLSERFNPSLLKV